MRQLAWAMVRLDNYLEHLFRDREKSESPVATLVAVVGISLSREFGDQEVRRLSALCADDGCTYALKETTFFGAASPVHKAPLVTLVRLADFDPLRPVHPDQITVVGCYASEHEARAIVETYSPGLAAEHAVMATRWRTPKV